MTGESGRCPVCGTGFTVLEKGKIRRTVALLYGFHLLEHIAVYARETARNTK